jgi:hypothetical protein
VKAYLLLVIDTRPVMSASPLPGADNLRRVSAAIYSEPNPSMQGGCRTLPIADAEAETYSDARDKLLKRVDDEPSAYAWVRPLLVRERAKR